jgi:hypothetical protein
MKFFEYKRLGKQYYELLKQLDAEGYELHRHPDDTYDLVKNLGRGTYVLQLRNSMLEARAKEAEYELQQD